MKILYKVGTVSVSNRLMLVWFDGLKKSYTFKRCSIMDPVSLSLPHMLDCRRRMKIPQTIHTFAALQNAVRLLQLRVC